MRSQRGIALAVTLLLLLILSALGFGVLVASRGSVVVSRSVHSQQTAFHASEAGLEIAREQIRTSLQGGTTFSSMLDDARDGGTLVDATSLANFLGSTGIANGTANDPFIDSTGLGSAAFQVFITNDRADGVTNPVDTNEQVLLTAFGSGANGTGFAASQILLRIALADLPQLPGVLTLPGPEVNFEAASSAAHRMDGENAHPDGGCFSTVAVSSSTALAQVSGAMTGPPDRSSQYGTCNPLGVGPDLTGAATTQNFVENDPAAASNPYEPLTPNVPPLAAGDPNLLSVAYLTDLVNRVRQVAHHTSPTDPGFSLGTTSDPKVVAIDGDFTVSGSTTGAGILLVTGELEFEGNPSYDGLVLAIGQGSVTIGGGGSGTFRGSMLVANTDEPWDEDLQYVGIPSYRDNGGGSAEQLYHSELARGSTVRRSLPLERAAFQQLR